MHATSIFNRQNLLYGLIFFITSTTGSGALAQATNPAIYMPPGQTPSQGAPPPPGSGSTAAPVIPGDPERQDIPSGQPVSSPEYGTNFGHNPEKRRSRINLTMGEPSKRNNTSLSLGGQHVVLTFQPDQLTSQQKGQVQGILGAGAFNSSQPYQNITVSQDQLTEMQNALAPSPDMNAGTSAVPMRDGRERSQIFTDTPAGNNLSQNGTNGVHPLFPVIQQFCRYLVVLGVVCACIFMAFSSIGLIFGDRNAGARIIASAGGIMLLLMGYAIWKVVRANEINARGPQVVDLSSKPPMQQSRSSPGDVIEMNEKYSFVSTTNANLPIIPNNPGGIQRSGLPLLPLGDAH